MQPTHPAGEQRSWAKATGFLIAIYLVGLAMIAGVVLVANKSDGGGGASASAASGAGATIPVTLTEFKIEGSLMAAPGPITLEVTNKGSMDHDLSVKQLNKTTGTFGTGKTVKLDLGNVPAGEYEVTCEVPGHKDAGMKATLTVKEGMDHSAAASGSEAASGSGEAGGTPNYAQMDKDMMDSFAKFPAKTKGEGNQVLEPKILPDGTKHFELTAEITDWEVEPGKTVKAWTYNGMVPAPRIMLNVGDKIEVVLHNKLPVATDIHWHGITVPFDQDGVAPITQKPIEPGQDFTYHFTVDKPEMGMYHPHLHGQMTLPNGMFGQIQVGPTPLVTGKTVAGVAIPNDVKPVMDFPMVLNDAGVIGFALNGKSFPATAPIVVKEGDWVTMTYYNEGLQSHPMHLHQFPQLVTAIDGIALDSPYWADTVLVAPGQRYTVMFNANRKGTWVFHCHILNHAERETGMFGMVTAVVVQ
ncbi:MAG: multicopper oxidase domain-containing protein [Actinobacteria bacterium]|nr:multicopper oxidase domain-containing protein [Actinomycetota bacterium]